MMPDLNRAATRATETLVKYGVNTGPITPIPILKSTPGVLVVSFAEIAFQFDMNRDNMLQTFSAENHDAMSFTQIVNGETRYFVVYNQRLPVFLCQRGLARELGHIILGHDGSRPDDVRMEEAQAFAYHFLCPRPLIKALQDSDIRFTTEVLGNATGCYERCLSGMRRMPSVSVPPALNRQLKDQFADYVKNFLDFWEFIAPSDESSLASFGTYMDGYEE